MNTAWCKLPLMHHADICHSWPGSWLFNAGKWLKHHKRAPNTDTRDFVTENDKLQHHVLSASAPLQAVCRLQLHHGGHERPQVKKSLTCKCCKTLWAGPTDSLWCPRCGPPCSSAWPTSTLSRWLGQGMVWWQYLQVFTQHKGHKLFFYCLCSHWKV